MRVRATKNIPVKTEQRFKNNVILEDGVKHNRFQEHHSKIVSKFQQSHLDTNTCTVIVD